MDIRELTIFLKISKMSSQNFSENSPEMETILKSEVNLKVPVATVRMIANLMKLLRPTPFDKISQFCLDSLH